MDSSETFRGSTMRLKKQYLVVAMLMGALAAISLVATASNVHFVGTPTCTQSGGTVTCTGSLAGLGSQTTTITATSPFTCTNRGGNQPGGLASGQTGPITPQNGRVNFTVSLRGSCPDGMRATFGAVTITAVQNGQTVFTSQPIPVT
jgi:hypothetical protein